MLLDELTSRLVALSVGVRGTNIVLGSKGVIPAGDGPILTMIETGGTGPLRIHNKTATHVSRPTVQVVVRGKNYAATRTMAVNAYNALDGVFNTTIDGVFYQKIVARSEIADIGLD